MVVNHLRPSWEPILQVSIGPQTLRQVSTRFLQLPRPETKKVDPFLKAKKVGANQPWRGEKFKTSWWLNHPGMKNMSQDGNLPQIGMKTKNIWKTITQNFGNDGLEVSHYVLFRRHSLVFGRVSCHSIWSPRYTKVKMILQILAHCGDVNMTLNLS